MDNFFDELSDMNIEKFIPVNLPRNFLCKLTSNCHTLEVLEPLDLSSDKYKVLVVAVVMAVAVEESPEGPGTARGS